MSTYQINTFVGLGSPGLDSKEEYRLQYKRAKRTIDFIKEQELDMKAVVDIAGPSEVGKVICRGFEEHRLLIGTNGNLDNLGWYVGSSFKKQICTTVLMTEVLEHILNPLIFFEELKKKVEFKDMIVSWPNRPSWLWTKNHFHEMDIHRFRYLCKLARYEIVRVYKYRQDQSWYNWMRGFRPFMRAFFNRHYIVHIRPMK